ncbi:Xaa-Pro aminopeptidase [Catenulispora sp. GAS73]|uniref:M24 family metallopeptidase n=1 Tax=Catenulispora sp. GAS73 TaxID=3156269 RepID=UPI0035135C78
MPITPITPGALARFVQAEEERLAERPRTLPFTVEEYRSRLDRMHAQMAADEIDTLILTSPDALCWLTGYSGRWYRSHSSTRFPSVHCVVVHLGHDRLFFVESPAHEMLVRLTTWVDDFVGAPESLDGPDASPEEFAAFLGRELVSRGWAKGRAGVERWSSVPNPAGLQAIEVQLAGRGCTVLDASPTIRSVRRLKSPAEISVIEQAQSACDAGLRELHRHARPGMTELEAWSAYMAGVIAAGGEPTAMHETMAAGPPMPLLHGVSTRRPIGPGEYFHADVAAAVHHYHARATRPFTMGPPSGPVARLSQIIAGAHDVLLRTARVGLPFRQLHKAFRDYFAGEGLGEEGVEGWAGGYELGVSFPPDWVGEFCWDSSDDRTEAVIEAGLVTNFESCAHLAMVDTVVFEDTGARLLCSLPRQALEITA